MRRRATHAGCDDEPVAQRTRLVTPDDAPRLAELLRRNRAFLAPTSRERAEAYFTEDGQRDVVAAALEDHERGTCLPHVVLDDDGAVAGRVTLSQVVRGPLQSASLGYWVDERRTGRGLATEAVREVTRLAFAELGLHRVEAGTLVDNTASQRVLERCGFVRYGLAPTYLRIAGAWRDHVLYQLIAPAWRPRT